MSVFSPLSRDELHDYQRDARRRTLELVGDLRDEQLTVPELEHVNPFLWELGHVAFFWEAFFLRELGDREPLIKDGDGLYDSFSVEHSTRWHLDCPGRKNTLEYMQRVFERVLGQLDKGGADERLTYLTLLAVLHEDMHGEAFTYMRQTLGYAAPKPNNPPPSNGAELGGGPLRGDVRLPGGLYAPGPRVDAPFAFDNEKGSLPIEVAPFEIAKAPVTNAEYVAFVEDDGYKRQELWSEEGWAWRVREAREAPLHWHATDGGWEHASFDRRVPLAEHHPVVHVSWYEAEAWCNWAGRRLPREIEWEMAASAQPGEGGGLSAEKRCHPWGRAQVTPELANLDGWLTGCIDVGALPKGDSAFGCRQMLGNVWEWTACAFEPYPDFAIDAPYRAYSEPWFRDHKVLRGGAWATRARLACNAYRNFFRPHRNDVFAGFRTCAR